MDRSAAGRRTRWSSECAPHWCGFTLPALLTDARGRRIVDPGFLGNTFLGVVTGITLWLMNDPQPGFSEAASAGPIVAAILAGVGGSTVLTSLASRAMEQSTRSSLIQTIEQTAAAAGQQISAESPGGEDSGSS